MLNQRLQLQRDLDTLNARYCELMRGRMVPTSRAMIVSRKIADIEKQIRSMDSAAADRVALERMPIDNALEVIAIPLLADVINDVVAGVDATLRKYGASETIFAEYTSQIRRNALAIVDTLANTEETLPCLLDVDDTLVDAVKKKLMSFIRQRLKIKKS